MFKILIIMLSLGLSALSSQDTYKSNELRTETKSLKLSQQKNDSLQTILKSQDELITRLNNELERSDRLTKILLFSLVGIILLSSWLFVLHRKKMALGKKLAMQNSQLQSVNKLFTNFLDQSIEAFTVFDSDGQILLWNKANENITGIKQEDTLGKYVWDIGAKIKMLAFNNSVESEKKRLEKFFRGLISKPDFGVKHDEMMIEKSDGEIRSIMVTYFPIKISKSYYFGIILWDITERKEYEGQLIIAKEQAELSDKLKSEFLAQISHEIRTPINTIVNNISLLNYELDNAGSESVNQCINSLSSAGQRIIRTIDLLIDISAIHTGTFEMSPKHIDLYSEVIEPCYEKYKPEAEKKGLKININKQCSDLTLLADTHSIKQIVDNLISNAVIFTDKGFIDININKDSFRRVYFEIIDTGVGISEEFLPKIYDAFAQEEQGYTRRYEGNGLGLTLVKEYCTLNDAMVSASSRKGEGTKFKVTFNKVDLKSILL